ncbi:MAG: Ig-like domain-containing protein [Verrucomicrobiota bacterium]
MSTRNTRKLPIFSLLKAVTAAAAFLASALNAGAATTPHYTVIGWNNLGMHCMDDDYSVFSILPPYNTVNAQVIDSSGNLVTLGSSVKLTYEAMADPSGSINKTSEGKTNFWSFALPLYGQSLPVDTGLAGAKMPGALNTPQPMVWDASMNAFGATGIPIAPIDDKGLPNTYPMMKLVARNSANTVLAQTSVVLPVSGEMNCRACHSSGSRDAAKPASGWVNDPNPKRDYRLNILKLHDQKIGGMPLYNEALAAQGYSATGLYDTVTQLNKPILCAACHSSEALPGSGYAGVQPLTRAVHSKHAGVINPTNNLTMNASTNRTACYQCHPGADTRCLRGAMGAAVGSDGKMLMQCQSCHGTMSDVGAATRTGWLDEPACQNCHTGTALSNQGQIRYTSAFDAPGHLRVPANTTFATNADTPAAGKSLYRFSQGHGGLQCEACHGSTHAEFISSERNDNIQSQQIQGHAGTLSDCTACHAEPMTVSGGPHGMHPVGQSWVSSHQDAANSGCRSCHGLDYKGTVLSRALGDRVLSTEYGTKTFWRGTQIGCYSCHNGPEGEGSGPTAPKVTNATLTRIPGATPAIDLSASPSTAVVRIVSQPAHGTVALVGRRATYFPDAGYAGPDSFKFAARDASNSVDSNLGTVTIAMAPTLKWKGDGVKNVWNTGVGGWLSGATATVFKAGVIALFDASGSVTPAVNLAATVAPGAVTVSTARPYAFSGAGSLNIAGTLAKTGTGTLVLNVPVTTNASAIVSAGSVSIRRSFTSARTLQVGGAGRVSLASGTLAAPVSIAAGGMLSGYGSLTKNGVSSGQILVTGGKLTLSGTITSAGTLRFAGSAAMSGTGTLVNSGALYLTLGMHPLPAKFVNNGVMLDTSSLGIQGFTAQGLSVELRTASALNQNYQMQWADLLAPTVWNNIGVAQPGTGSTLTFSHTGTAPNARRVYRIILVP